MNYSCNNLNPFKPRVFLPESVANEPRGKGQVDDRCLRHVRTIFDGTTSDANAELVLGEVVTMQGGWSSYPPHHHSQPEIYHYRFTEPQGYGHGELGETAVTVECDYELDVSRRFKFLTRRLVGRLVENKLQQLP